MRLAPPCAPAGTREAILVHRPPDAPPTLRRRRAAAAALPPAGRAARDRVWRSQRDRAASWPAATGGGTDCTAQGGVDDTLTLIEHALHLAQLLAAARAHTHRCRAPCCSSTAGMAGPRCTSSASPPATCCSGGAPPAARSSRWVGVRQHCRACALALSRGHKHVAPSMLLLYAAGQAAVCQPGGDGADHRDFQAPPTAGPRGTLLLAAVHG